MVVWNFLLLLFCAQCLAWPCEWPLLYENSISPPQMNNTKTLQLVLNDRYASNLTVTGIFDAATTKAVKTFQAQNGFKADGRVGTDTWIHLLNFTVSSRDNSAISAVQLLLGIQSSGVINNAYVQAVINFQSERGLKVTGQVGLDTWHVLVSGCNSSATTAVYGFDIGWPEGSPSDDQLFCLVRVGFAFGTFQVYTEGHKLWTVGIDNIVRAHNAGIPYINAYHFPLRTADPKDQVQVVIDAMTAANITWVPRMWLDVEGNGWKSYTKQENVDFLKAMRESYENGGFQVGIYVGREYPSIFGDYQGFSDLPVWYAHYDNIPSFVDWWGQPYGGWKAPSIKQFWDKAQGADLACGVNTDWDWSPNIDPFV